MGALEDIRDILRGAFASLGGFGGRMLARLALMIIAGQLYGAGPLGVLGQVAAITEILAAIAVLGLRRTLLDVLSETNLTPTQVANGVKEALLGSLIVAATMSLILWFSWPFLFPDMQPPLLLLFVIPAIAFADVAGTAIRFKRIIRWEVIARCVMEPWAFLLAALGFFYSGHHIGGLVGAYAVSAIAAAIGIGFGLHHAFGIMSVFRATAKWRKVFRLLKKSLPTGIADIGVMMFRRVDILLLSLVAGHQVTGIYYMAQQIVTVPHKIHQLFEPMMSPVLARLHHTQRSDLIDRKLSNICRWVYTLQLAITVPFIIMAPQILGLFGEQFIIGATVLTALLVAELLDGSFALAETPLVFARRTVPPRLVLITLAIEVISIGVLASFWDAAGAAFGFLIAMVSLMMMRLWAVKKYLGLNVLTVSFLPPLAFSMMIAMALVGVQTWQPLEQGFLFGSAIFFAVCLFLLMVRMVALNADDKKLLARLKLPR